MTRPRAQNARPVDCRRPVAAATRHLMMRINRLLAAVLVVASAGASAEDRRYDPKALARYDVSYVRCETSFPEMKGHRDDAYMSLWRMKAGSKTTARLAEVRTSAAYKSEQRVATREAAGASTPEAIKGVERQCRALWGELQKSASPKS